MEMQTTAVSIVGFLGICLRIMTWWDWLARVSKPAVAVAEQCALDGIITKDERKKIALQFTADLEKDGKLKLNPITRFILNIVIDRVAQKLPDFETPKKNADAVKAAQIPS